MHTVATGAQMCRQDTCYRMYEQRNAKNTHHHDIHESSCLSVVKLVTAGTGAAFMTATSISVDHFHI